MYNRKPIDFLDKIENESEIFLKHISSRKRKSFFTFKRIVPTIISFIMLLGLAYTTRAVISSNELAEQLGNTSVFEQLRHLVSSENKPLDGEEDGRINILLLGIGGENHDGGQLTDTIMVASVDPVNRRMGVLSIPRDLVVPIPKIGWQKINAAHAYGAAGNAEDELAGVSLAIQTVEGITGLNIHYFIKIDFDGFVKIVDALGGVRVEVPTSFTDNEYPDENFGYEKIHFDAGWQNFDGEQALKYARSRHGSNGEGTDFARSRRQQQILQALQARTLALSTLLNPNKLIALSDIIGSHIQTNMELWKIFRLYEIVKEANKQEGTHIVLSTENGLLVSDTNEDGSYLLRPRASSADFSEIKLVAKNLLDENPYAPKIAGATASGLKISIQNGTLHEGLANRTAIKLQTLSFNVIQIENARIRNYEKTVIYKLSDKASEAEVQSIKEALNANVAAYVPDYINTTGADVLIIVGEDNVS